MIRRIFFIVICRCYLQQGISVEKMFSASQLYFTFTLSLSLYVVNLCPILANQQKFTYQCRISSVLGYQKRPYSILYFRINKTVYSLKLKSLDNVGLYDG